MKVTIVGNGVWGNALFSVISQNTDNVTIAKRGEKIIADVVVLAVPTSSIRDALPLVSFLKSSIVVNSSKGIERNTHMFPYQIVEKQYGNSIEYFSLMGPSFAEEVMQKMPTLVNLATQKESKSLSVVQSLFSTPYFCVRPIKGTEALEIAGALKNVYAIACGIADGLGYKTNTKTQLISLAIEELLSLYEGLGVFVDPKITPELVGDIVLTCTSGSRNYNFGKLLPTRKVKDALKQIASTVEGYNTSESVKHLEEKSKRSLPVATFVRQVLETNMYNKIPLMFEDLLRA